MKKSEKIALVLTLRDAALTLTGKRGDYRGEGFSISSQPREPIPEHLLRLGALHGLTPPVQLPHGLDVWSSKKVLNMEWDDHGSIHVVSFHRGEWESRLLALAKECVGGLDAPRQRDRMIVPQSDRH